MYRVPPLASQCASRHNSCHYTSSYIDAGACPVEPGRCTHLSPTMPPRAGTPAAKDSSAAAARRASPGRILAPPFAWCARFCAAMGVPLAPPESSFRWSARSRQTRATTASSYVFANDDDIAACLLSETNTHHNAEEYDSPCCAAPRSTYASSLTSIGHMPLGLGLTLVPSCVVGGMFAGFQQLYAASRLHLPDPGHFHRGSAGGCGDYRLHCRPGLVDVSPFVVLFTSCNLPCPGL